MRLLLPGTEKVHHAHGHAHAGKRRALRFAGILGKAFRLGRPAAEHSASGHRARGGPHRVALLVGGLMLGTLCLGDRGLIRLVSLLRDRAAVQTELIRLEAHRADLARQLRLYTADSATIEKVARESLDWVRRGETVYKFPSK